MAPREYTGFALLSHDSRRRINALDNLCERGNHAHSLILSFLQCERGPWSS